MASNTSTLISVASTHTMLIVESVSSSVTEQIDTNVSMPMTGNLTLPPRQFSLSQYVIYGVVLVISFLGLIGNIFTILVLNLHKPKSVYMFLLQVLAIADGLVMFFTFILIAMVITMCSSCHMAYIVLAPLHDIAQFLSHWTLVTASLDRYLAFENPFRQGCIKGCSKKQVCVVITIVVLVAVLLEIPRMIPEYSYKLNAINMVPRYFVPLIILMYLNFRLVIYIRNAEQEHNQLTRSVANNEAHRTRSATIMLIVVVFIFLFCSSTRGVYLIITEIYPEKTPVKKMFSLITWTLMVLNNAVNFVIYVMFYKKFRQNLRKIFPCCFKKKLGSNRQTTLMLDRNHRIQSTTSRLSLTTQTIL